MASMTNVKKGIRALAYFWIFEMIILCLYFIMVGAFRNPQEPMQFFTDLAASINGMGIYEFAAGVTLVLTFGNFIFWFVIYFIKM